MSENPNVNPDASPEQNDVLPDWAREKLSKANAEAAKYRTEKNEAIEAAKAEVASEYQSKIAALEAQIGEAVEAKAGSDSVVEKLKATINAELAADAEKAFAFADLLKGDTPEELSSHAEQLKKLFITEQAPAAKQSATDPSQGQSGKPLPLNGDPLLEAVMSKINRSR